MRQDDTMAEARHSTFEEVVRRRLQEEKQSVIARAISVDPAVITRFLAGQQGGGLTLTTVSDLVEALGLRVHHGDLEAMPAEEAQALRVLAKKGLWK